MKRFLLFSLLFISPLLAAPFAYIVNEVDIVTVIDLATNEIIATIPVGAVPVSIVITPTGTKAYVTNNSSNDVSVIDTATNTVIATVPVGPNPFGLDITHDGRTVYVANSDGTLTPIDVATDTAGAPIVGFVGSARDITISPDDRTAYVTNELADTVTPVDLTTGTLGVPIPVGDAPNRLEITPNGQKVYVLNVGTPNSVSVISTATNTVIATILLPAGPQDLAISFDSRLVYVSLDNDQVVIISTSTDTIINSVSINNPFGMAFFPCGGQILYIVNEIASGTVTPLDVATNTLGEPFAAGPFPIEIAITPIIDIQGKLIKNIFLNKVELVLQICWNVCPITTAAFFRVFQNGIAIGQVFAGSPSNFVVCLSPNFVCHSSCSSKCSSGCSSSKCSSSSDQTFNVELGLFAASGVEIARIPLT